MRAGSLLLPVQVFVGVGASRVRDMFKKARSNAPCILFIDEFDGIGQQRSSSAMGNDGAAPEGDCQDTCTLCAPAGWMNVRYSST